MEYLILAVGVGLLITIILRIKNRKKSKVKPLDTSGDYIIPKIPNHDAVSLFPSLKNILKNKKNVDEQKG